MYNISMGRFLGYTYENMENDLGIFSRVFHGHMHVDSIGRTPDGRQLYRIRIGDREAAEKILLFGGIHGREYMTSQLLMEQTAEFLTHLCRDGKTYKGIFYSSMMKNRAIHVIPMANPDGISISQFGIKGIRDHNLQKLVAKIAEEEGGRLPCGPYFTGWKANARGVDLNRNFDARWEDYQSGKEKPSSETYKGFGPECEPESAALARITRKEQYSRTISYHSSGEVIYWNFGQEGKLKECTQQFARKIGEVTGYKLDGGWDKLDPAGYKDWALLKMQIPSLTIEIGRLDSPLPGCCFREILRENRGVWEETLLFP